MNAYKLAEFIETGGENIDRKELSNMLRQQADRIAELEKYVGFKESGYDIIQLTPQTKRLEKTDVYSIALESGFMLSTQHGQGENLLMPVTDGNTLMALVRAIEERHGIK